MEGLLALEIDEDLLATCSALGYTEGDLYYKGDESWECMKDLIRFLRLDQPENCTVRRQLGRMQTLQKDLLPILVNFHEEDKLLDVSIKLLINLTQPALLCMADKYSTMDVSSNRVYLELNQYLQEYKESFTNEKVMHVLGTLLARLCNQVSNLNFHINGIDDLLIYICNSSTESQWMMHGLEIIFLMMREQSAARLASVDLQTGRPTDDKDFELLIERERERKRIKSRNCSARHSHFGGTYVIVGYQALDDSENILYHKPLAKVESHSLDADKRRYKVSKQRVPALSRPKPRQTTISVRRMLQQFSISFLEYCYNPVMRAARDMILRHHHLDNDETYYLWAVRFFMEFNRLHKFRVDLVSETLTMAVTNFIMSQIMTYLERTLENKSFEARPWSRRLHYSLKGYREVLEYIQAMSFHSDSSMRDNADIMQSNLFYTPEYREIFHLLLRNYDQIKSDKDYLCDLIETTHLFLKLIENYCKKKNNMLVQGKRKKGVGRKKTKGKKTRKLQINEADLLAKWAEMEAKVMELLQPETELPTSPLPFDAASDVDVEEQKNSAVERIVELLDAQQQGEAVALLRAARGVWPDSLFGSAEWTIGDECNLLRETFVSGMLVQGEHEEEEDGEEMGHADDEEERVTVQKYEMQFDVENYVMRFAHTKIVYAYCLLLKNYHQNTSHTNHCIIKMLHRISVQCKMAPMLYHISVFVTMDQILNDPAASKMKEMVQFAQYIVSGFFKMATANACMFAELLFWKRPLDVCELQEGYGTLERKRALKLSRSVWTFEQEEQLTELYHKHKGASDLLEAILIDLPLEPERTRRQIAAKLLQLGLVNDRKELHKRKVGRGKRRKGGSLWTEHEVEKLQDLFFEFALHDNQLHEIAAQLSTKNADQIVQKLQELGLMEVSDQDDELKDESNSSNDSNDDDNGIHPARRRQPVRSPTTVQRPTRQPRLPAANCVDVVRQIHETGMSQTLEWLEENLAAEAEDRAQDDEWENLPLVAVSTTDVQAVQHDLFVQLLAGLGMTPPEVDQEFHWCIPSDMTPEELKQAVKVFHSDKESGANSLDLVVELNEETSSQTATNLEVHADYDIQRIGIGNRKLFKQTDVSIETVGDDCNDEISSQRQRNKIRETKRKRVRHLSDDSTEEMDDEKSPPPQDDSNKIQKLHKKRRQLMDDSESDDDVVVCHNKRPHAQTLDLKGDNSDSESDVESTKKLVIIESDSEH